MTALALLACAVSDTEARFVAKVDTGPVRIAYTTVEPAPGVPLEDPVYSASTAVDAQGVAKVTITGLTARTRYWWRIEDTGVVDDTRTGTFLTPPPAGAQASFTFTASGDAGLGTDGGATGTELVPTRISNHPVHELIADRMLAEDWLAHIDLGDIIYYDYGRPGYAGSTLTDYRRGWDDLHVQPHQVALFEAGSFAHVWDDHDYGPNDSDGTLPTKANAAQVFREREPHHDLPDAGAIYRTWSWGRVQVVIWDCRYYKSPEATPDGPSKTMLGSAQKAWFEGVINASTAEVIIIVSSVMWMDGGASSWPHYATERQEITDMITAAGKANKIIMLSADAHKLAIDTGGGNDWGRWPCAVFAARDATASAPSGAYDVLEQGGIGQYGTVTVSDLGGLITVKLTAWQNNTEVGSYTKAFATATPVVATDITEVISGSHTVVVEARVCTEYQTGSDPEGTSIPVLSGDVRYDATANIWSTVSLQTLGIHEVDLMSMFPRHPRDLLAPYGSELFIRYGIDLGPEVLWTPMGYYRIDDTEQPDSPYGDIRLSGPDRMQSLIDARLTVPRQYRKTQAIGSVVEDLVLDVLPDAVISWDDDTDQRPVGRDMVVEKDRAAALRDVATSNGKVLYFDSEGILRIETAPDPTQIAWELKSGRNGVLVSSSRRVSREGVYNGVVAKGEGTVDSPAIGIAVDTGTNSPTRWGSRFGKVPRFYSSPLISDDESGYLAAAAILRRSIGMPYSVDFGAVPNPGLRPRQAIRVEQSDGNREVHLPETLSIPFLAGQHMRGTTREQTLVQISSVRPGSPDA
ncbi:DUF5047 domain-containing protein [Glycomyces sp. NPDC021274]|uniref:DUF5047 domain-containing protein n=1 Tax=Glycomyces sp. NPDC021274 TaxID=3155120 RepID=UPI0033E6D926